MIYMDGLHAATGTLLVLAARAHAAVSLKYTRIGRLKTSGM